MAIELAALVYLGVWVVMAGYVSYHAKSRGSRYWFWHFLGGLGLGFIYAAAYGLHVKFQEPPQSASPA